MLRGYFLSQQDMNYLDDIVKELPYNNLTEDALDELKDLLSTLTPIIVNFEEQE